MPKTIEDFLTQTRPATKGPRVRGKSKKRRGAFQSKGHGKKAGASYAGVDGIEAGFMAALSGMGQSAQTAYQNQAIAQAQAMDQQVKLLCEQQAARQSGAYGLGRVGGQAASALGSSYWMVID